MYLREREKLARDLYRRFHDTWQQPIFKRIADTRQRQFESVELLLHWYKLEDPAGENRAGVFNDAKLRQRYAELIERGESSKLAALQLAARMEEKDVSAMLDAMVTSRQWDIVMVYETLMSASRNSLENLVRELQFLGHGYRPQVFAESEFYALFDPEV